MGIVSFPSFFYPDEDYRSILYRSQLRSHHESYIKNRKDILGKATKRMVMYPENLLELSNRICVSKKFADDLIYNHTFYSLFHTFYSTEQKEDCEKIFNTSIDIRNSSSRSILDTAEIQIVSKEMKYCPTCLNEDFKVFGESYMHRMHQLKFLDLCPIHNERLITRCPICSIELVNKNASIMLIEPKCKEGHFIAPNLVTKELNSTQNVILQDIKFIMNHRHLTLDFIYQNFLAHLGSKEFIHYKGYKINKKQFLGEMVKYYGEENLKNISVFTNELLKQRVMTELFKKEHIRKYIILYILIMRFLSGSVEMFFANSESYSIPIPFGIGPWKCINRICPHFNQYVINKCKRKVHEWITGYFSCESCGIVFTRKSSLIHDEESNYSIETMGFLFVEAVNKYYNQGLKINEIALKVYSNTTTVRKYISLYNKKYSNLDITDETSAALNEILLGQQEVATSMEVTTHKENKKLEMCKSTILEVMNKLGSGASRKQIKSHCFHRYDWVMKHDKVWMEENLPPRRKLPQSIDFDKLDDEIFELVKEAMVKIVDNPPKEKIVKSHILRLLPGKYRGRFLHHKEILPKSLALINQSIESDDDYAIRLFPKVIQWFEESRYKTLSLAMVKMKFKVYKKCSSEVLDWVQQQIVKVNRKLTE